MASDGINATQYPIEKIFSTNFIFKIPRYQRPYAWTIKQADELLDDLLNFMGNVEDISKLDPYFMGTIVLIEEKEKPNVEIVDGQQRLVTLTILLAVLRFLLPSVADELTSYLYDAAIVIKGTPNRYRLKLRKQDQSFFEDYIQKEGGIAKLKALDPAKLSLDSQRHIHENAHVFLDRLSTLTQEKLIRLAGTIVTRCFLVVVTTSDIDSAYRIFSILNGRGLNISLTDILKSDILSKVPPHNEENYTDKWENAEEQLGRDRFEALFSHIRMIYRRIKLQKTVLAEIREYVRPTHNPEHFIDEVVLPYTNAFDTILNTPFQGGKKGEADAINVLFKWLNRIDNSDWLPPAILYLARNNNDATALLHFFADLERLSAGLMILRKNVNYRIERYGKILTAIEKGDDLYADNSPLQLREEDEQKELVKILDGDIYFMIDIRQYVLLRLDEQLADVPITFDHGIITVEHVLPQNPALDSIWLTWFPDDNLREGYVHRLGNLVLLSRKMNSKAGNLDFAKKKETYFKSPKGIAPFPITTQVIGYETWTPDIVEQRQQELVGKLKDLWRLKES